MVDLAPECRTAATAGPWQGGGVSPPDFALRYRGRNEGTLSPRLAEALWVAATFLGSVYSERGSWHGLRAELPRIADQHADEVWLQRFAECFDAVAFRLQDADRAPHLLASCTAEELALHIVIDVAEDCVADGTIQVSDDLPFDDERDRDFDLAREVLFRDHDVLLLFNAAMDGIDDPDSELSIHHRFANLHPSKWFLPFADSDADP